MRKKIIFVLAAAAMCRSLQANADVQPVPQDSVHCESHTDKELMFQPINPTYHKGVLVTSPWNGNWFVSLQGGAGAFIGKPIGCADLFDRAQPALSASIGKWFTPRIGTRISYNGWRFKDCNLASNDFHHFHADLMYNVLGGQYAKKENPRWGIVSYLGLGLMYNPQNGQKSFAVSYGVQGQYRICKRLTALLDIGNVSTFQGFDGYGNANRFGDNMFSVSAGLFFTIGRVGWKRAVDATPYIRQNEWLVEYASELTGINRRYAGQHDRDVRMLNELKKILEIEGLLEKYGRLFDNRKNLSGVYPKNNYSGLNSLRARLRNRHWDGKSPLANDSLANCSGAAEPGASDNANSEDAQSGKSANVSASTDTNADSVSGYSHSDYLALINSGNGCIGSPVYFFFEVGTAKLTDKSQLVNLDELARVAKKYGLSVTVVGAADAATGTAVINDALSISRADYIATELVKRGLAVEHITKVGKGGISDYNPTEANRHTKVQLFMK